MVHDSNAVEDAASEQAVSRGIPKEETGVLELFQKYPKADGRGVKIAILDTGCDLQAAGLQQTSDGKPKYLDFLDCTGDSDIKMEKTIADFDYKKEPAIEGLSGRKLNLGEWASNLTSVKLGAIRLFELLPTSVERRIKRERKEAFLTTHRALISETQKSLDDLHTSLGEGDEQKKKATKQEIKELEVLIQQLKDMIEGYQDYGPTMDIVMYQDGDTWKVAIDLEANGDLTRVEPMAPFAVSRQVGTLAFGSQVTFCVQVYDQGNTLSIVTDAGSHGTHVAGIAAANFSDQQELNGVAPGAQILACKIGDGRLGSAETGTGLIRALIAAKKYGCDLINLSYGEPSWQPDSGRVAKVFADATHEWGMTVFTSAGNDGPALSSLGSPGALSAPITVGAFVSPEMMVEQYSTLPMEEGSLNGASYYFSSRGPTPDGQLPDICAPGGAIAPIPRHALQGKAQYHGTSMSSPNACGVTACVLSALKQKGIENVNPTELKRGIMNSANKSSGNIDPFAMGAGLISAVDATEYIMTHHGKNGQDCTIDISIPSRDGARGIYIRDEAELDGPMTIGVLVQPRFSHSNQRTSSEMDELLSLEMDLSLKSTEPWVTCPSSMRLLSAKERGGQSFSVRLDTANLPPGVHFATIDAHDVSDPARGSIFSLPVTVVVPHSRFVSKSEPNLQLVDKEYFSLQDNGLDYTTTFQLEHGVPNRRFFTVPETAEWATIKLRSNEPTSSSTSPHRILVHAIPLVRGDLPNTEIQLKRLYQTKEGVETAYHVGVKGGSTLELCLQLLWLANPTPALVTVDIEYHSLNARSPTLVSSQPVTISAASEFARLGVNTPLRAEKLDPAGTLKSVRRALRPGKFDIASGSTERDILPPSDAEVRATESAAKGSQIYEMRLSYDFSIDGDDAVDVRPSIPSIFNQIYDSPLDSQLWILKDSNAQVLGYGGAMHHASAVSLKKGSYSITLLLRHPDRYVLDQLKDIPCEISLGLPKPLSCTVYSDRDKASTPAVKGNDGSAVASSILRKGSHQDIYVSRPTDDLPSWVAAGDILQGSLALNKAKESVTSMDLLYVAPPKSNSTDVKKVTPSPEDKDESLEDVVFKAKLDFLAGIRKKNDTSYDDHAASLKEERPLSVPLLMELLAHALECPTPKTEKDEDEFRFKKVEIVYTSMLKENGGPIDQMALAQYFGMKQPGGDELEEDPEAKKLDKDMKEQKSALMKILLAKAVLAGKLADDKGSSKISEFDGAIKDLKKWVAMDDLDDQKQKIDFSITMAKHERICQKKTASAIATLMKSKKDLSGADMKQVADELLKVYESCKGMEHLATNLKEENQSRFPVVKRSV